MSSRLLPLRRPLHWLCLLLASLGGCGLPPEAREPMALQAQFAPVPGRTAVVFLPGRKDRPEDFVDAGFIEALQSCAPGVDAYLAQAHIGYYAERNLQARLDADVIRPLQARGYSRIHLVGVSMGGLGALLYLARHPEAVDGVVLIAPYLGEAHLIEEIRAAGGVRDWPAPVLGEAEPLSEVRDLWRWIKRWDDQPPAAPVHLAYGEADRFAPGHALLARQLPPERILRRDGGHRWAVWRRLWDEVLAKGDVLPNSKGCG